MKRKGMIAWVYGERKVKQQLLRESSQRTYVESRGKAPPMH